MKKNNYIKLGLGAALSVSLVSAAVASALTQSPLVQASSVTKAQQPTFATPKKSEFLPAEQRYIVMFKETTASGDGIQAVRDGVFSERAARSFVEKFNGDVKLTLPSIKGVAFTMSAKNAALLANDPSVALVESDPKRFLMAESTPYGITMVQANQLSDSNTSNFKVCIMDTGYDRTHADLRSASVTGSDGYGSNDTGNWYNDGHGHGTHVAGTISAIGNNNTGVVGVNPSGVVGLHIVKVFNDAGSWAYGSDLVVAVDQCRDAGAKVISMSLGGGASSTAENTAFENATAAGLLSIAAAGNDGNSSLSYPASYDSVMSVAAIDSSKNIASFSQYNSQVEIAAPGVAVNSTLPGNSYASWNGTSMATPHVSGVAALVWSNHTTCTSEQIRNVLNVSAEDLGSAGRDNYYGYGLVQAKAASDLIASEGCDVSTPPPPPPPSATELTDGQAATGLSGSTGSEALFVLDVPANQDNVTFTMSGGTGDADLYVRAGAAPDTSTYDCRPYKSGNSETCSVDSPSAGDFYAMVRAYSTFSGVSLTGDYSGSAAGGGDSGSESGLSASSGNWINRTISVPAGSSNLSVSITGGTGDADLYTRFGSAPTTSSYDCRPYKVGNEETCTVASPSTGTYHVGIRAYTAFSGVTLNWSYE
jgi:serine protease